MERGRIIVIEGSDGTGKATTTKLVLDLFNKKRPFGAQAQTHSFPTYDQFYGRQVRAYLDGDSANPEVLVPEIVRTDPICAALPYAADRYIAFKQKLQPIIDNGDWLILDRYFSSNLAHMGVKITDLDERDKFQQKLLKLELEYFAIPKPDLIIFLHLPENIQEQRTNERRQAGTDGQKVGKTDLHEQDQNHLINSAKEYTRLGQKYGWQKIDCATQDSQLKPEEVAEQAYEQILVHFKPLIDR